MRKWTLLAVVLLVTACGTDPFVRSAGTAVASPSRPSTPGTALLAAMGEVAASDGALKWIEYGEPAWWAERGVTDDSGSRWLEVTGSGMSTLGRSRADLLKNVTGIDPHAVTRAISIGDRDETKATRLDGTFQAQVVRDKMTGLGAMPYQTGAFDGLTFGDPEKPPVPLPLVNNRMNYVAATDSTIAVAPRPESVLDVLGGERSPADDPRYAGMAGCLGDVVAAMILAPQFGSAVAMYGVGVRRPAGLDEKPVNVVCVLGTPEVKQQFTTEVTAGALKAEEVAHDEVQGGGSTFLRATARLADGVSPANTMIMLGGNELQRLADPVTAAFDGTLDDTAGK